MNKRYVASMVQIVKPWYKIQAGRTLRNNFTRPFSSDSNSFDPYKVLGVDPGSSFDEVRNQYMKLSKQYHPDYNPGNEEAEAKFITLTKAYRTLVKNIEKTRDPSGGSTDAEKTVRAYDFTVEPLGIETDKPKPVSLYRPLLTFVTICIAGFAVIRTLNSVVHEITDSVKENMFKTTPREREKQLIEETRLAMIEYHRKKERVRELYEKASR